MSQHRHTDEEVKEHLTRESEVCNCFGADSTSANDSGEPSWPCDTKQNSSAGFPNSTLPVAAAYTSSVLDARRTGTNDLREALHTVADSNSRPVSRTALTAFVRGTTKLGPIVDTSALVPHIEASEKEPKGQATNSLEVTVITSRLEGLDTHGAKYPASQTTPGGGSESCSMKPQAGDRSRFRPWGYI